MKIQSLAISGLLTMEMHSLNNEGSEGNYMLTRQVDVVDTEGTVHSVNAVSGDMFKHIQAEHFYAAAKQAALPLCGGCVRFDPNRINVDDKFAKQFSEQSKDAEILDKALLDCAGDDCEGILITKKIGKARAIGRKSVVEFGWVVGRPEQTRTESFFHVKYDRSERGKGSGDAEGANIGQNIFHRPASSGQYAVVVSADLYRVGFNDITQQYSIDAGERLRRVQNLIKSVLWTFVKPAGAMRNTQNPHIVDFRGVVSTSVSALPAPTVSALNPAFEEQIEQIAASLNRLEETEAVSVRKFMSLPDFSDILGDLTAQVEV